MSDLKPKGTKIQLGNQQYGMRFTLNAIDDIQEHFDVPIEGTNLKMNAGIYNLDESIGEFGAYKILISKN
jgi:hypothetical protein